MLSAQSASQPIRVMLVDDSAIIRGLISRGLKRNPNIQIVATASDGDIAIATLQRQSNVDVILLDVEMPNKNGLEALPELKKLAPHAHVIMVSTLTQRNAKISLQAMELGATDYLAKPSSTGDGESLEAFYQALILKVEQLGQEAIKRRMRSAQQGSQAASVQTTPAPSPVRSPSVSLFPGRKQVLAIASSTGGPQALQKLFKLIKNDISKVPVFVTQHMPPTFTGLLAGHIRTETGLECHEGVDGELVQPGRVYIAPGGFHMTVAAGRDGLVIKLDDGAPVNFCKPAADPMFDTLADHYGKSIYTVVLTGMGNDGCKGAKRIKEAGGYVIVQDKETSVVWGMPGAIAAEGFQDEIASIEHIAESIKQALN
jgi:two-component system, chemotaxis family, protein-glutamate methylesterase/glutaminase